MSDMTCITSNLGALLERGHRYGTIYADPPWPYANQASENATSAHYESMSISDIAAMPVRLLAEDNAHLHLWTTNAFLFDCAAIMDAWGFTYKSVFVWLKPQLGLGNYWRVCHEFLLLGVRGHAVFADKNQRSWIEERRTDHSVKPEKIRRIIEAVSPAPRLELFGRRIVDGWTVFGNQIERTMFEMDIEEYRQE